MIKRVSIEKREQLRKQKEDEIKLSKLVALLIAKGIITKEEIDNV